VLREYFRKSATDYSEVDLTHHPNGDMLQEATTIKAQSAGHHPEYAELALTRARIRGASGAYWKFTYDDNGVTVEVLDLLWVENTPAGPQSYAMLFSAAQSEWSQLLPTFITQARSFAVS
jgi:hypothetical protein